VIKGRLASSLGSDGRFLIPRHVVVKVNSYDRFLKRAFINLSLFVVVFFAFCLVYRRALFDPRKLRVRSLDQR
jgi:hypothetical protein